MKVKTALSASFVLLSFTANLAQAATVVLTPNEATSKDVFVYQFFSNSNFDNLIFGPTQFGNFLAVANVGSGSTHNIKTLIDFDLSGTGIANSAKVGSAILTLHTIDGGSVGFPIENPSAGFPIQVSATRLGAAWTETGVTFNTAPATTGPVLDTKSLAGLVNISLDITSAVKDWIDNPSSQFGVLLAQVAEVRDAGTAVGAVFASSALGSGAPTLTITTVPEPGAVVLASCGAVGVLLLGRVRRKNVR